MISRFSPTQLPGRATLFAAGLLASALVAHAQKYSASAAFSPAEIPAGQVGTYQVNVSVNSPTGGSMTPECTPPHVDGLEISPNPSVTNFRQSTQFVNGAVSGSLSFTVQFQVRAQKNGHYTVPSFDMSLNGTKITVPEASLEVTDQPAQPVNSDLVSLQTNINRKDIYVGEMLPFDITLYWRADLSIQVTGDLDQGGDAFERIDLSGRGEQSSLSKGGQSYFANVWHSDLIPIKAGPQTLNLSLPMDVTIPDANGISDPLIAQFIGPNSPFNVGQQRSMVAQVPPLKLNVLPLPTEGRPEHFTGGIGTFSADEPTLSTEDLQVGVPVTLTLKVSGHGNFGRFNTPELDLGSLWRTYPTKNTFQPQDSDGYHGEKTFQYVIMPMSENITSLPAPEVNFFNPESKSYIALPLQPIGIKVRPPDPGQAMPVLPTVAESSDTKSGKPELVPLHLDAGAWQGAQPAMVFQSPLFWAGQAAPAIMLLGFVLTRRRQLRIENDPVYARSLRARKQADLAVAQARAAAAKGDAPGFYAIAQRALQEAATHDRLDAAEALTWREFDAHLAARGVDTELRRQAREIFDSGDALRFGGYSPDKDALAASAAQLDGLVQQLLASS